MNITKIKDEIFNLQKKVFTRWVNDKLKYMNDNQIEDTTIDLSNSCILIKLAKTLTKNETIMQLKDNTNFQQDMKQYIKYAIDIFSKDGVKFDELTIKNIDEKYNEVIQNIIWELISHYSINKSLASNKPNKDNNENEAKIVKSKNYNTKDLLSWATDRVSNYPHLTNCHPYELFICALLDSYVPDKINYYALNPNNSEYNMQLALGVMKCLGIPIYIYQEDISKKENTIDEKALLTQLSSFKIVLDIQESMTQTFSISSTEDDEKTLQNSDTSSNTFVEFDYDSFSQSESQDKLTSKQQLMTHDPSLLTLSNSESIYKSLTTALSETQRISQKEIEKLMTKIDFLTEQLYESRGKIGELTKKEKIDQITIENLKQKLTVVEEKSETQSKHQSSIDDLSSQICHLQKELSNSENLSKELQSKLSETEKNDKTKIEKLKEKLLNTENQLNECNLNLSDSENKKNELSIKLSEVENNNQKIIDELKQKLIESENQINNLITKSLGIEKNDQESINILNQKLNESANKEKELTKKVAEIEKSKQEIIDKLSQKLTDSENQFKELTKKLSDAETSNQETVNELNQKLIESEKQINDLTTKLTESENQTKELTTKISDAETSNQETVNKLNQKLIESEKQINNLTTRLTEAQNSYQETINSLQPKLTESENQTKELTTKLSEIEKENNETIECLKKKLAETLDMNKSYIDQLSSQNQTDADHLSIEIDRLNKELSQSLSNEKSLQQKLEEAQSNYNFATKQLSEVTISMRKALLDSEMKSQTLTAKAHQEIDELTNENNNLKEELQISKSNETKLANELEEAKKKSESEVNHLMLVLSDSENRCVEFYRKSQEEIDSLTKQLEESKEQTLSAQLDFQQMKQAFSESQARVFQLYEKLYNAK